MGKYEDMLQLERPASPRQKMRPEDRAAQFSPFAALTGYEEVIDQTAGAHLEEVENR